MESNPLDFLKEEMNSDQLSDRVNAIYRTVTVATVMGPDKIKKDLIPYFECLNRFIEIKISFSTNRIWRRRSSLCNRTGNWKPKSVPIWKVTTPPSDFGTTSSGRRNSNQTHGSKISHQDRKFDGSQHTFEHFPSLSKTTFKLILNLQKVLRLANGDLFTSRVSAIYLITDLYSKFGS